MPVPVLPGSAANERGRRAGRGKITMTPLQEGLLEEIYRRMEEELLHYHLLGQELKKESEFLRRGSLDLLTESLLYIEMHVEEVRRAHASIARNVEKMVSTFRPEEKEKTLGTLLTLLPANEAQRIKGYQRTLAGLKKRTSQINTRNKASFQESHPAGKTWVTHSPICS
jgi:hypothetical protein